MRFLTFLVVAAVSSSAFAFVGFDTYAAGNGVRLSAALNFGESNGDWRQGVEFTVSGTGLLDSIEVDIAYSGGDTGFRFELYDDVGGLPNPGSPMLSWTSSNSAGVFPTSSSHRTLLGLNLVTLVAGNRYYLEASTPGDPTDAGQFWYCNDIGYSGRRLVSNDGDDNRTWEFDDASNEFFPAMRVNLNPVPEPASMVAMAAGAAGMLLRRRRNRS